MNKKKLLLIYLNEFNYDFIIKGAKKYNCNYINNFFKKKKINTFTKDKVQNKNLDPWVQNVSINTGKPSKIHKIYNIGQNFTKKQKQIWDFLSNNNIKSAVWGPMNATLTKNKNLKLFVPDPWNFSQKTFPERLKYMSILPAYYAQNYLEPKKTKLALFSLYFFYGIILNKYFFKLIKYSPFIIKCLIKKGLKNFILFLILDLISVVAFKEEVKKEKVEFAFIFLNSIAHYQHNNWDDKSSHKIFFEFINIIFKELFITEQKFNSVLIFNGFSQKKTKNEYILRPINPEKFLKKINLKFKKLEQDMTNGGLIFFKSIKDKKAGTHLLKKTKYKNLNFFHIKSVSPKILFYRLEIKLNKKIIKNKTKFYIYNENRSYIKKEINISSTSSNNIFKDMRLIKSSGKHHNYGELFFKNINIPNN